MSSRRAARETTLTEVEINDLIFKLQTLLPDSSAAGSRSCSRRVPASKILKDICNYIKILQQEVDNLSETLSQQLASRGIHDFDLGVLTRLLQQ